LFKSTTIILKTDPPTAVYLIVEDALGNRSIPFIISKGPFEPDLHPSSVIRPLTILYASTTPPLPYFSYPFRASRRFPGSRGNKRTSGQADKRKRVKQRACRFAKLNDLKNQKNICVLCGKKKGR